MSSVKRRVRAFSRTQLHKLVLFDNEPNKRRTRDELDDRRMRDELDDKRMRKSSKKEKKFMSIKL